ncbi:MAG: CvpA family protein, partial [Paracoccaceae bacterium]|nr:CvpA family protein [Paracoccaceae bacterium]
MAVTITDAVVLLIVVVSAMLAFSRGITREVLAIGGWIVAALAAFYFAPMVEPLVREIPVVGDFLRSSCTLSALAAFTVVFALALMLLAIFTPLVSSVVRESALGPVDKALGFVFGAARGLVLVAVLYLLYDLVAPADQRLADIDNAQTVRLISDTASVLRDNAPREVPDWLARRIDRL